MVESLIYLMMNYDVKCRSNLSAERHGRCDDCLNAAS